VRGQIECLRTAADDPAMVGFFESPAVTTLQRQAVLEQLADGFDPLAFGLLTVMNRRNRLGLIGELAETFFDEDNNRRGRVPTRVTTAVAVDDDQMEEIRRAIAKYLGREPVIEHQIDSSIIGGFVAQAGSVLIDGSVRAQLETIRNRLVMRGENEVQSG